MLVLMRWLGNAGFEFQLGKTMLLVDPFLTRPKAWQVYFSRVEPDRAAIQKYVRACDHILVSHAHFDHCMDVSEIARRTGAQVHGSANICRLACMEGLPEQQTHLIQTGEKIRINGTTIKIIPAAHPIIPGYTSGTVKRGLSFPIRLRDYRMDTCLSFLIHYGKLKILVWSSTSTKSAEPADVLICRAVSSRRWYREILAQVQPRTVIPSHWDDMFQPLSKNPQPFFNTPRPALPPIGRINLEDFRNKIEEARKGCRVLLPHIFESYDLQEYV
jgi:L-ascorbate metabolism protein UlaG (beta-lactamase superfamily)